MKLICGIAFPESKRDASNIMAYQAECTMYSVSDVLLCINWISFLTQITLHIINIKMDYTTLITMYQYWLADQRRFAPFCVCISKLKET